MWPEPDFNAFVALCQDPTGGVDLRHVDEVVAGVPIYDGAAMAVSAVDADRAETMRHELASVFADGPGVIVVRQAWHDRRALDAMTELLWAILDHERTSRTDNFDHFAAAGANSRAWDTLGKAAARDPAVYVDYYANPVLDLVCEAWLGPWYQPTAQVNVVHPGGAAQSPHRDYHLGFLSDIDAARFPEHVHRLSPTLTLQGGVAHTAMPLESGPTMVLPGSQRFTAGYLAWRDARFAEYFAEHHVQIALDPGDAIFFNPALHHGAGENRTADCDRMANLLQVSSAFGVAMEAIDWPAIAVATYPVLLDLAERGQLADYHLAVCASGYAFPSNLDTDPSDQGLAPGSAQAVLRDALDARLDPATFGDLLATKTAQRAPFSVATARRAFSAVSN